MPNRHWSQLLPDELDLWNRMSRADRRHATGVARRVETMLGAEATRPVVAAALLHDVGKLDSNLGVYGRVIATISGAVVHHDPEVIRDWTRTRGFTRHVGFVPAASSSGRRHAGPRRVRRPDGHVDTSTPPATGGVDPSAPSLANHDD